MSEDKAVFRACGNCGCRIDGFCVSEVAKENNCAMDPDLPCWIPEGFAKVVAQCTEKPGEQKIYPNMVDPRGKWEREDTIKKNNHPPPQTGISKTQWLIRDECQQITETLLEKNRKYGDSAINPVRVFSRADAVEQINVRLDDKISRIMSGQTDDDEDVELDLIGYLVLKRVQRRIAE
jgi:hypothetical protein